MDRTSKLILAALAAGIWYHAIALSVQSVKASDEGELNWQIEEAMARDIKAIADGTCRNYHLCHP